MRRSKARGQGRNDDIPSRSNDQQVYASEDDEVHRPEVINDDGIAEIVSQQSGTATNTKDSPDRQPINALERKWQAMFARLLKFKATYGHCLVPNRYTEDHALGAWVSTQRRQYKILVSGSSSSTPMTPERAAQLEDIGFVWATTDPRHVPWETRYEELVQFREKYGHSLVPIGFKENSQLANWVSTQRQEYKLLREGRISRLTEERVLLLNALEFIWEAQRGGSFKRKNMEGSSDDGETSSDEVKCVAATIPQANFVDHVGNIGGLASGVSPRTISCSNVGPNGEHNPLLSHSNPHSFGHFPCAPTLTQNLSMLQHAQEMDQNVTKSAGGNSISVGQFLARPTEKFPDQAKPVVVYCHNTGLRDPDGGGEFVQTDQGFEERQEIYRIAARNAVSLHQARQKQRQALSTKATTEELKHAVMLPQGDTTCGITTDKGAIQREKEDRPDLTSMALRQVEGDKTSSRPSDLVTSSTAHDPHQKPRGQKQQLQDQLERKQNSLLQPDFAFTVPSKARKLDVSDKATTPLQTARGRNWTVPKIDTTGQIVTNTLSQVASSVDADIFDDADDDDGVRISYN